MIGWIINWKLFGRKRSLLNQDTTQTFAWKVNMKDRVSLINYSPLHEDCGEVEVWLRYSWPRAWVGGESVSGQLHAGERATGTRCNGGRMGPQSPCGLCGVEEMCYTHLGSKPGRRYTDSCQNHQKVYLDYPVSRQSSFREAPVCKPKVLSLYQLLDD
jgi:hypothetical protein